MKTGHEAPRVAPEPSDGKSCSAPDPPLTEHAMMMECAWRSKKMMDEMHGDIFHWKWALRNSPALRHQILRHSGGEKGSEELSIIDTNSLSFHAVDHIASKYLNVFMMEGERWRQMQLFDITVREEEAERFKNKARVLREEEAERLRRVKQVQDSEFECSIERFMNKQRVLQMEENERLDRLVEHVSDLGEHKIGIRSFRSALWMAERNQSAAFLCQWITHNDVGAGPHFDIVTSETGQQTAQEVFKFMRHRHLIRETLHKLIHNATSSARSRDFPTAGETERDMEVARTMLTSAPVPDDELRRRELAFAEPRFLILRKTKHTADTESSEEICKTFTA